MATWTVSMDSIPSIQYLHLSSKMASVRIFLPTKEPDSEKLLDLGAVKCDHK